MQKYFQLIAIAIFVLMVLTLSTPSVALAQMGGEELPPGVSADDVYRVSRKMYCDVCQGVPVSDCPSTTCLEWREEVAVLLSRGYSDDEILQYFAENYGDEVSGVPIQDDDRILALGLPILAAVIIGIVVIWQVWQLQQRSESRAMQAARSAGVIVSDGRPVPDNVNPDYLERFLKLLEDKS